jgi:hypothetical protein
MIAFIIMAYMVTGLSVYAYAVLTSSNLLGFWDFSITKTHVALYPYPFWLMGWIYYVGKVLKRNGRKKL